jgi:hypothetical protein
MRFDTIKLLIYNKVKYFQAKLWIRKKPERAFFLWLRVTVIGRIESAMGCVSLIAARPSLS